jgi:TPR repeat protein
MFNFFRKKKNKEENNSQPTTPSSNNQSTSGTGLEKQYNDLLQKHRSNLSELKQNAQVLIDRDDYNDKNKWMDALAICDIALENKDIDDTIKELYKQIYSRNWNKYASCNLSEDDYLFWFNKNADVNNRFIQAGHHRGWCEQADLYNTARRPHRDLKKMRECLLEGVKLEDPASLGDYGYGLYMGIPEYTDEANKEAGLKLVLRSKELGYPAADLFLLYIAFYTEENDDSLLAKIIDYIEIEPLAYRKPYHLLADFYLRKGNDFEKAVEAMKKGVELNQHYSMYLFGMNILNGRIENEDKTEAIKLLGTAYEHYVPYAANFLGQYYYYANDENSSVEKAIEWHEKATLYYQAESSFELASIYLYNEKYNDREKGLKYLEQSIEEGSARGLSEKAYLMLETDILPNNIDEAKSLLEKAMNMGNEYAPYRLGLAYQNAEFGGEPDYQKALELFELGAEREHLYSIELAGNYYRVGVGGEDKSAQKKAVDYLNRAIERGSNYARVELAFCYEVGYGVEKDFQKAFDLFKDAASNNYPYANSKMAGYLEDGVLGEENVAEALVQYKIAAEAGMPDAIYHVGRYNKYAVGIPENPAEAMRLFQQSAEGGSAPGLVEMALAYEQEYGGTEFDAAKALEYMTKAAEMNYTYAQHKLGTYYYYGLTETDYEKAHEWFSKAYEAGYPWSATMLGDYYLYNAAGQEPEYDKAFNYYKFAEEQGVVSEGLGICYEYGLGVEENATEAFKYYTLAAKDGYTAAKYRLALCYKYGRGTTENLTEAYRWFAEAAEEGNFNSQFETAMMLLNGEGVAIDTEKAIQMLTTIAEENHDDAQFELGNCYLTGKGVAEDEAQAMYWYQRAAENGNEQAQKITGKRERRKR